MTQRSTRGTVQFAALVLFAAWSNLSLQGQSVSPQAAPSIVPATLPPAALRQYYLAKISVDGGTNPGAPKLFSGALPPGLVLGVGYIGGTPTAAGTFTFTLRSVDGAGAVATRTYALLVASPLAIDTPSDLPQAVVGRIYRVAFQFSGGAPPVRFALQSGVLPKNMKLDETGVLSGTPTVAGAYTFTLIATEASGLPPAVKVFKLTVASPLTILNTSPLPSGTQGSPFNVKFEASGGIAPYNWVAKEALPRGLTLTSSGVLSGILGAAGSMSLSVIVTDSAGQSAVRAFAFTSYPAAIVTTEVGPLDLVVTNIEQGPRIYRSITISTSSQTDITLTATVLYNGAGGWLEVPSSFSAVTNKPNLLLIGTVPGPLGAGTYTAQILLKGPGLPDGKAIKVTLAISPVRKVIVPSSVGLTFSAIEGISAELPPQRVYVINSGEGVLDWNATATPLSGGDWLRIPVAGGSSFAGADPGVFTVRVDPIGLTAGDYYGQVTIRSTGAVNSPQYVTVVLRVRPPSETPAITTSPSGVMLSDSLPHELVLSNSGKDPVEFYTGWPDGQSVYTVTPESAIVPPGGSFTLYVQRTPAFSGVRRVPLSFTFSKGESRTVDVVVLGASTSAATAASEFRLAGVSPSAESDSRVAATAIACTPTQLVPVSTLLGAGFNVPAGWPTPVEVRVVNDCGEPLTSGSVTVSFSNGDVPLPLVPLGDGRWSSTWVGRNSLTPQVTVTVNAEDPVKHLSGFIETSGGVEVNPEPPVVASGGIVNAASYVKAAPVSPGSFISIFGSKFATTPARDELLPFETTLGVTTVTVGGRVLPLQYTSDGQINAVVPYGIPLDAPQSVLIRRGLTLSVPEQVVVTTSQPGVFTRDQSGQGQGVVVDQTYRLIDESNPAKAGDIVAVFSTGLGPVAPEVEAGRAAPAAPAAQTVAPVTATIGGLAAEVKFAGLAPGFSGLYQVNLVVPSGLATGVPIPVVLSTAGNSSPPVTIYGR